MNANYSYVANSKIVAILCGAAILFAMVQCGLFFRLAYRRGLEIGMTKGDIKKIVKSSAIFSIIPSLPILISYVVLLPALGKFFPWLRLSVIGSATYETIVADMAVTSFGYNGLGDANFTADVYGSIMWVVTLGIMISSLSVLILKRYDNKMQEISSDKNSFGALVGPIMFLGMMATFSAPYLINFSDMVTLSAIIVSAISMLILEKIASKVKGLKEFTFPLSMILGMVSASIVTNFL